MARPRKETHYSIYDFLVERPGCRQTDVANGLHLRRARVNKVLASDGYGDVLIMEDNNRLLYPIDYRPVTVADYIAFGMGLKPLEAVAERVPDGTHCALSGIEITYGYPLWSVVPDSAGEFLDMLGGATEGYVAENVARAFKGTWNMGSWLIFEDGAGFHPLIAREAALKQGRPCWSDLVRQIWPDREGQPLVGILTTDFKKRLWPRARVGALGNHTRVYVHDPENDLSANLVLDWPKFMEVLDFVETIYTLGFSKPAIRQTLTHEWKAAQTIGLAETLRLERELQNLRPAPEFAPALIMAQKKGSLS